MSESQINIRLRCPPLVTVSGKLVEGSAAAPERYWKGEAVGNGEMLGGGIVGPGLGCSSSDGSNGSVKVCVCVCVCVCVFVTCLCIPVCVYLYVSLIYIRLII